MPNASCTILSDRAVLSVSGPDAVSFLQGLVSNDVEKVSERQAIWAAFLTPQGKYLHDFMIAMMGDRLLLDCEADRANDLRTRLKRFRLRAEVDVSDEVGLSVAAFWGEDAAGVFDLDSHAGSAVSTDGGIAFIDPRLSAAGVRYIVETNSFDPHGCDQADQASYDAHRIGLGLPDGSRDMEIEKALLLENGFEELGGVDFNKGCYIGQELTARTHYRALIKKRLLPVEINGDAPAIGAAVSFEGKDAGEMKSSVGQRGLALIRLATWQSSPDGWLTADGATIKPVPADWMVLPGSKDS